jgi:hypothetical protein
LASALLRWLTLGWQAFTKGGIWRKVWTKESDEIIDAESVVES